MLLPPGPKVCYGHLVKTNDIISYHDIVHAEKAALQKGMNYELGKGYSVFLMSVRRPHGKL